MTGKSLSTLLLTAGMFAAGADAPQAQKPATKPTAAAKARENYSMTCQPCHGPEGKGVLPGTDLTTGKWKHGSTITAIAKTISEGIPGTVMLPAKDRFTKAEIQELAKLARSFKKTPKPPAKK